MESVFIFEICRRSILLQRLCLNEEGAGVGARWELWLTGKIDLQVQGIGAAAA